MGNNEEGVYDISALSFFKDFTYFLERGEGREKDREKHAPDLGPGPQPRDVP